MKFCKKTLSFILAFILMFSTFTPVLARSDTGLQKTTIEGQELVIGDKVYYIFSTDKNAKDDLIKSQEKSEEKTQAIQTSDGLNLSENLFGGPVGAGRPASYTLNIKGNNFKGVGGKTFDWDTLPEGFELQVFYIDENYLDVNIGNPITINKSNYQDEITRTFDLAEQPLGFGFKTNVDTETYLTDAYLTNESAPEGTAGRLDMTFDLVQVPSTKLDVKWVDVNQQPLARENTPATTLKDILTFNFIENKKFDLPNQDKVDSYFRLNNKIGREEVKDIKDATALVDGKKGGEEVTLDGKIYKLTTSYDPALNKGSKIQLMYMPDVIDRTKNPESPTPENYVRVTIDAGEGTKLAEGETKKVYDVRIGKALKAEHYPKLEISDSAKYKEPITWTIAPGTAITKAENIKGNAAKTAAETITAANLKAVDTTALQGQDFPEKFWNDGVALADNTPADKKDAFAALLKDATVTDITNPVRTTAEAGDKVGTLLVTFKDGSKLEVPNQKLIVKPNTVTVAFDKAAGKEHPLRDGDTTVKGKITASSNSDKFPVSLDGAVVTIKKGNKVLTRTLANADGSFVAGVKDKLIAGEDISVVVTLPESKTESAPVTEKVQLNPDKLNVIISTGNKVVGNLEGKKGVNQDLVKKLKDAIKKANDELVEADGKVKSTVEVSSTGQKSLDDQYEAIKKAIEELTGNSAPKVTGTSHKEIFKGDDPKLEEGITVTDKDGDKDIELQGGKKFSYTVEKIGDKGAKTPVTDTTTINQTAGTYEVTYTAKDKSKAEGKFVMTLVVKKTVIEVPGEFPTDIPEGYVTVEFKEGAHGKLEGTKRFLVKDGSAKTIINAPTIKPNANYEAKKNANWDPAIPETFTGTEENKKSFVFTAQYTYIGKDVVEQKPGDKKPDVPDNFVKVEFKKGDHGVISSEETTIYWVNPEKEVTLTAPTVTPSHGYKHTGWNPEVQANTKYNEAKEFVAQYKATVVTEDPHDTEHYAKVDFAAGDQGKFEQVGGKNQVTTFWVWKGEKVSFNAPKVTANENYKFKEWDKPIQETYDGDTTHTATYESTLNISDTEVKGYQEVKFVSGNDGNFGKNGETPITEKSLWVKPDTLVDLRKFAPQVTATTEGKTFTGWDKDLVGTFALETENGQPKATVFTAQYSGSTSETPVPGWTEITFKSGEHGRFGTLNNTPIVEKKLWVDPKADVKLLEKAPKTIDDKNWSFDKWMDGQNPATGLDVAGKYTEAKTYTASYKSDISNTPQNGFVKVTFAPGTDGSFEQNATTEIYVRKDKEVDITDKAPKVIANKGLSFKGWAIDNAPVDLTKINVNTDTTITAQYTKAISDKPVKGWTRLQFNSGENGRFVKDAVTVKWVDPKVKLTLKEIAPGITPDKNYRLSAWNDGNVDVELETEKLFEEPTTFTAKYEKISSETEIPGFTKITFNSGDHGNFGTKENNKVTEKNIWVNPKSEVKLSEIAPELVIDTNWSFDKWMDGQTAADMDTAKKYTAEKTYTATYESDFSDVAKEGFVKVEFLAGDHGKFEQVNGKDQVTTIYVRKDKEIDITVKEPKVTPDNGYYFTGWDKPLQKVYTADTTHTGKNEKAIATEAVDGWTQITFNAGDKGLFKPDAKTVLWVKPNVKITLKDQVPGLEIEKGYSCIGWKKDAETSVTDLKVPATYDKSTTFTAAYESDFSKETKEGFIEVKFKAGDNGNFGKTTGASSTEVKDYSLWVRPDKEVDLTDQAPKVYPHVGWKANGWDKTLTITVNAQTAEADRTFTAQYLKDDDVSDTKKEGYIEITFNAGDHGTFPNDAKTVKYVNPDSEIALSTIAPTVNPAINYSFKAWNNGTADVALDAKIKYTQATNYKATYESDISDTPKNGFVEVKFEAGTDGEFKQVNGKAQQTTFYVKKDKLVDLTDVAPTATGKDKKTFIGWNSELKRTFTDASTTINAKYTESISDKYVPGWTQLDFDQGDHGRFVKGQKNVKWVDPAVDLKLDDIAPKINLDPNWSLKAWNDGTADVDGTKAQKFTKATTFTATYESDISENEDNTKVKITFKPGTNGKFKGTTQVKSVWIKANKDVDLRDKAPTVIPNQGYGHDGWKNGDNPIDITKVNVSSETEITASYATGSFDKENIVKLIVLGPEKASYKEGEPLDLTGLKVEAIDNQGIRQTYTYKDGKLLDNNDPANELVATLKISNEDIKFKNDNNVLKVNTNLDRSKHNGKPITVEYKNIGYDTIVKLTVLENQSAQPTDVVAANQTDEKATKVKGKAVKDAVIKITDANGNNLLPEGTTVKADANGDFTADLNNLLNPGTKVIVTATEPGKSESPKAETTVIRDKDGNWKADTGAKLSTPVIDPIREKDEKVVVEAPKADDKIQTIEVSDQNGKTVTLTKDPADTKGKTWIVKGSDPAEKVVENNEGKLEIPVKDKLPLNDRDQIKVTFKDGEKPANEAFDKAPVQKASQTPKVDQVYTGDKSVKIVDPTVADPTAKTIKVKAGDNDSMTVEKQPDGSWKVKEDQNKEVKVEDGKIVVPLDPSAKKDELIKVSTINDSGTASPAKEVTVIDKEKLDPPTINPIKTGEKTVSGTALTNKDKPNQFAASTVDIFIKDGNDYKLLKEGVGVNSDGTYNYPGTTDFKDGDVIRVVANKPGWTSSAAETTVGVDTTALDKAIKDGKGALVKTNDGTPEDKALEKAIQDAEDLKKRTDPKPPTQKELDDAKDKIEKAIENKKKTDEERQKLKDIIKEAEEETKKDGYKDKPESDKTALEKAIADGKENLANNTKIVESTTTIQEKLDIIRMERIRVGVDSLAVGMKTLEIKTSVPGATVKIKINGVLIDTIETDAYGNFSKGLETALQKKQRIVLEASKLGYNDGIFRDRVQ